MNDDNPIVNPPATEPANQQNSPQDTNLMNPQVLIETKSTLVPLILAICGFLVIPLNNIITILLGSHLGILIGVISILLYLAPIPLSITALIINKNNTKYHTLAKVWQ